MPTTYYTLDVINAIREPRVSKEIVQAEQRHAVPRPGGKGFLIDRVPAVTVDVTRQDEVTRIDVLGQCYQVVDDSGICTGYRDTAGAEIPAPKEARVAAGPFSSPPWEVKP